MGLWKNEDARVPLALIGVLFVLISAAASINLSRMDARMATAMATDTDINAADTALLYARADLARIVNYAGMEALKQMGETPVIEPDPDSQYSPGGEPDAEEFNRNWARGMMTYTMNQYIESNYMYDSYQYGGYAVNVEPISNWNKTDIIPINMALDRDLETPLLAPNDTYNTYWKATVPLTLSIVDLGTGDIIDEQDIVVGNLITSRYPLLESLTSEYERRLNGADAVMTETTAFAMAYTWTRGYLQYYKPNGPENIVSNEHLALIVNGALLADQGFVFNSVDTASIIEYAIQTKKTMSGDDNIDEAALLSGMELSNGSFQIDPQADAANSTGDPDNATEAMELAAHFDYNATPITDFLNNDTMPDGSAVRSQIQEIIPQVYSTTLATGIDRQVTTVLGNHDGYDSNHWTGSWGEPDSMSQVGTVSRDADVPGNLYGEIWEASWTREHVWRDYYVVYYSCEKTRTYPCTDSEGNPDTCTEVYWDTCSRTEYNEMTTIDTRNDRVTVTLKAKENSKTSIPLNYAGTTLSTINDIDGAYTSKEVEYAATHTDPGLEEAYDRYKSETFDPNVESNVKNMGLDGDNYDPRTIDVTAPGWLETEVRYAVDEITGQIRSDVHLSPDINYMVYPNPADAMEATAIDLTNKIEANQSRYVDKERYYGSGKYSSCSAKTISQVREWYVDEVLHQVDEQYMAAAGNIDGQINDQFNESADDVREANEKGAELLKDAISFPIGLTMRAEHVSDDGAKFNVDDIAYWEENVTLGVDMEPNYLFEDSDGGKKLINLGVQNVCFFGPTGVPVLPPPNYVVQFNSWMINVEGQIDEFTLQDVDNEVHPNPMFGHEAQVYKRGDFRVIDPSSNLPVGNNFPIYFEFTTGTFIAVPPAGKPIGDRDGYDITPVIPFSETSANYGEILEK